MVAHSLDRVHRLVHLERLGHSNSSLGTDIVAFQARCIQRQVVVSANGTENGVGQHTNTLRVAQGDGSGQRQGGALT